MRQYDAFKKQYPDCILFFRMGDFYEMFDEDAVRAHKALGITLTERTPGIPMAGVPYHSMSGYLAKLIEHGFRVAVCDQVQDPREAKGVVERAVTRVITPGTLVDEALLTDDRANHLAAAAFLEHGDDPANRVALAIVELSTGSFTVMETTGAGLVDELARRDVSELLYCEPSDGTVPPRVKRVLQALGLPGTPRPNWHFRFEEAHEALLQHYRVASLTGFGMKDDDPVIAAAGAVIRYLNETQALDSEARATSDEHTSSGTSAANLIRARSLAHLAPPRRESASQYMTLDATGLRALEIERTIRTGSSEGSLLGVFARRGVGCRTPMGRRLLRDWLCAPLLDRTRIEHRHRCVGALVQDARMREELRLPLREVQDVARIMARVALGRATPRDLVAVGASLRRVDDVVQVLDEVAAFENYRSVLVALRDDLTPIASEIVAWCVDNPPSHLREGGLIRDGIDAELDEARSLQRESSAQLAAYQAELIERYDLPSLKVGFNKVFGYYIELPRAQARRAPDEFTRKQTLKNAERYITP
ncbi:MAG: DNA mismatch repair protein MutS, partial [Phycisphaerales bacterium]|nr:DNA mismatch repair protein MutS [Phycisphaerales bacterium]